MARNTRERILTAALEIFARDGYAGTNIKDIADAVGIVKSALYRHFESKEEIWNAVQDAMVAYYDEHFGSADKPQHIPADTDELYEMTMRMVSFTIHDKNIILMRRILLTEQFRNEKIRKLATNYFLTETESIFTKVFEGMMKNGSIKETDPAFLAFSYTAPITSLIHLCDREPETESEAIAKIQSFIRNFIEVYGRK